MKTVSFVFPVWNEQGNLEVLYHRVRDACLIAKVHYEMVFVDNGSTDRSLEIIKMLAAQDQRVKYLSLSRNFGHQNALFAGMGYCTGDAVITMDADLQHPPALIPPMISRWEDGAEVVYTMKRNARLPMLKTWLIKGFYWLISKMSGLELDFGLSDFRLLDRRVANVILKIPEYHKFLRAQVKWVGFKQQGLGYEVEPRYHGQSKFTYRSLFAMALDGIFSFSRYPLRVVALLGLVIVCLCVMYLVVLLFIGIFDFFGIIHHLPWPPGWATLTVAILLLGSIQLVAIGLVGEYVGRIYDQTKGRPVFIVREASTGYEHETETRDSLRRAGQPVTTLNG